MKYYISILIFLFINCQKNDKQTLYYLNEGIERCNGEIEVLNEWSINEIEKAYQTNTHQIKIYKINIDLIQNRYEDINKAIKQKKDEILAQDSAKQTKKESELFAPLAAYTSLLDSLFPNDSIIQSGIKKQKKISKSDLLNLYKLNLLLNEIENLNHFAINYFIKKIEINPDRLNVNQVAVIPKSKYLYNNEIYQANLCLFAFDSASKFSIEVDNKIIESHNGKAIYFDTDASGPKLVFKLANLKMISNSTGEEISIPFYFRYKFVGK